MTEKQYWEQSGDSIFDGYCCPECKTDAVFRIVKEGSKLVWRLENYCPHCGLRLYNPNLDK